MMLVDNEGVLEFFVIIVRENFVCILWFSVDWIVMILDEGLILKLGRIK